MNSHHFLNFSDNNPIPPTKAPSLFKIDYNNLYITLCKWASSDIATLLLYILLHRNSGFKSFVLNKIDIDLLVSEFITIEVIFINVMELF